LEAGVFGGLGFGGGKVEVEGDAGGGDEMSFIVLFLDTILTGDILVGGAGLDEVLLTVVLATVAAVGVVGAVRGDCVDSLFSGV